MAAGLDGMECNSTIEIGRSRQKLQQQKMIKERQQRVHKLLAGLKCVTVMINIIILIIWESYYSKNTPFSSFYLPGHPSGPCSLLSFTSEHRPNNLRNCNASKYSYHYF